MKKHKLLIIIMVLGIASSIHLSAASPRFNLGLGVDYLRSDINSSLPESLLGLTVKPSFSYGAFSMALQGSFYFSVSLSPFQFTPWMANWEPPARLDEESDISYALRVASHYSSIIDHISWGAPDNDIYFRWGRLNGYTMGDGSLLNQFEDQSIATNDSRPGIVLKIDARQFNFPWLGMEFVTDDIFHPSLLASRVFVRPCTALETPVIRNMQVGLSFAMDPYGHSDPQTPSQAVYPYTDAALDLRLPLVEMKWIGLSLDTSFILQFPNNQIQGMSHAFRAGLKGWITPWFFLGSSLTVPTGNGFIPAYFSSGFTSLGVSTLMSRMLDTGSLYIQGQAGLQFFERKLYLEASAHSVFDKSKGWKDYGFRMKLNLDKQLFNILGINATYDKLYPTLSDGSVEPFGSGILTMRNVIIDVNTLLTIRPMEFSFGIAVIFDETGTNPYIGCNVGLSFILF